MADEATNQPVTTYVPVSEFTGVAPVAPVETVSETAEAVENVDSPAETVDNSPETVTSVTHTTTGPRYPYHFGVEGRKYL